jgi:anaerobic magnesium-protoporphyrin IX monomethyl ester cyclase
MAKSFSHQSPADFRPYVKIQAMSSGIRQRGLEENLPAESSLRTYLEAKTETGTRPAQLRPKRLVHVREPLDDWPSVLLMMPPITLSEGTVKRVIPPLGLAYIAGYLEERGVPCELYDCIVEGLDREEPLGDHTWRFGADVATIAEKLASRSWDILGLSIIYSSDLPNLFEIARIAKQVRPEITVVAGGLHPSIYAHNVLSEAVLDGRPTIEGEMRLADFIANFRQGNVDRNADGLAGFIDGDLFVNPQIATIADLDALPFPSYHKLPMERYFAFNVPFSPFPRGRRVMQIYTSRGCPVGCTFCASTNFNKSFRARSVENIIAEVEYYKRAYAIDEIQFADDNLTLDRRRALQLFTAMRACKLPWCTPNGIMVNTLTTELVDAMVDSGLYQITLSIDSGNAKTLREQHRKPVDLTRVPDLIEYLRAKGVLIHGTLVVGMPGETADDIAEGFRYVESLDFNSIGVFIAQALPGSEIYETALHAGAITVEASRRIDTARSGIQLSAIAADDLERLTSDFIYRYNRIIHRRDPEEWKRKYDRHRERLTRICIGRPAPNTDGIIHAAQPSPSEIH